MVAHVVGDAILGWMSCWSHMLSESPEAVGVGMSAPLRASGLVGYKVKWWAQTCPELDCSERPQPFVILSSTSGVLRSFFLCTWVCWTAPVFALGNTSSHTHLLLRFVGARLWLRETRRSSENRLDWATDASQWQPWQPSNSWSEHLPSAWWHRGLGLWSTILIQISQKVSLVGLQNHHGVQGHTGLTCKLMSFTYKNKSISTWSRG